MKTKVCLRRCMIARRAALSVAARRQKSATIARHVTGLAPFRASQTVMVYLALAQEVQTWRLIVEARRQHKRIVVPAVTEDALMAVVLPTDTTQLRRGAYGILEPCANRVVVPPADIDFVVVPGVAFDRQGGRVGFGKGYYDRFLYQVAATARYCGLAFSAQVVSQVPRMPYDVCMHYVATEEGVVACFSDPSAT